MSPKLRPLRLSPADPLGVAFVARRLSERGWVRVHFPGRAVRFALDGEHRFSFPESPHPALYAASDEETAALEVFGDRLYARKRHPALAKSEWTGRVFSSLRLPPVRVADLTFDGMAPAKVDASAVTHRSRGVTHAWARAVMAHLVGFHGLLYPSRFTGRTCVALFALPGDAVPEVEGRSRPFAASAAAAALLARYQPALV
jgi:hypothetical protein